MPSSPLFCYLLAPDDFRTFFLTSRYWIISGLNCALAYIFFNCWLSVSSIGKSGRHLFSHIWSVIYRTWHDSCHVRSTKQAGEIWSCFFKIFHNLAITMSILLHYKTLSFLVWEFSTLGISFLGGKGLPAFLNISHFITFTHILPAIQHTTPLIWYIP